ncbi:hypothetical protein ACHAXR_013035 [Thalassiosira sp. AJA248-18]
MQSSGLSVDTAPLEEVLLGISQTLNSHDLSVSKLPKLETAQCDLRKDLNKLRLAFESIRPSDDSIDSVNESKTCDSTEKTSIESSHPARIDPGNSSSYGIRKSYIEPIQQKHAADLSNANDRAIANSLREIKTTIRRLQQDRDEGLVNSMEMDEGIKTLKESLFEIQQKLSSTASTKQIQALQQSLLAKYGQIEHHFQEFKTSFHEEVEGSINQNLSEVKSWFKDLEALVQQRQAKLEQRVASCAREYDVAAFRESIESDVASLSRTASFLDDTAKAQGKTLVMLQQKNAIAMFHRHYTNWKQNALKNGISRWKQVVKHQIQYEEGKEAQKRLVRKILTNIMSRRKGFGFKRWIRYRDWHRKAERQKLKASTLICERLGMYLSAPKTMAFNRWRRLTLMDKMKCRRDSAVRKMGAALSLNSILGSFRGDVRGAMHALALEIESIKSHDIASLRQDWCSENHKMMSTIRTTMDDAIHKVEDTANAFQESVNERVDSCTDDLPLLQSKLKELSDLFESSRTELKIMEEGHTKRIDTIFAQDQQLEQRLCAVEGQTKIAAHQITSLFEQQTNSNESIQDLREVIAQNEERHEEERSVLQNALNLFGDELLKTKVTLGHTQVRCESLEKELAETKAELAHFQDTCQSENDKVRHQIHHPGVPRPSLDRIVNIGHAYETLAKEKNYVTGINVMATLRTSSKNKMKRSEENTRKEEEVDVPSEIVAFAHDYAAWVAYQADHESLLRLIAGTNPEEQVYAEDDLISRRKELCNELKSKLGALLEKASSYPAVEDGTGGLGLRWEARAIFLARVVDATNAALSKHDQILLPASTRLGRVRPLSANVTVCVACDRPMRRKGKRHPEQGVVSTNVKAEKALGGRADSETGGLCH